MDRLGAGLPPELVLGFVDRGPIDVNRHLPRAERARGDP